MDMDRVAPLSLVLHTGCVVWRCFMEGNPTDTRLNTKQVAALLKVTPVTVANWRKQKIGPRWYRRVRKIFYLKVDVESWEFSNPGQ